MKHATPLQVKLAMLSAMAKQGQSPMTIEECSKLFDCKIYSPTELKLKAQYARS